MKLIVVLLSLLSLHSPVYAIDPGFARGSLQVGSATVPLTHAYAQLHDNTEKLLDYPKELRILVCDREVEQKVLNGLVFLPVRAMAREGAVRGLLITFDPKDTTKAQITVLYPPADPGATLITQTRMNSAGVIKDLKISDNRVQGKTEDREEAGSSFHDMPSISYAVSFSAPLFHEPKVTEDLKGQAVKNSPQIKVLRAAAQAMQKGDFDALRRLCTERALREMDAVFAQSSGRGAEIAREAGKEMATEADSALRIVVRGDRAVVLLPGKSWKNLERVDHEWKIAE